MVLKKKKTNQAQERLIKQKLKFTEGIWNGTGRYENRHAHEKEGVIVKTTVLKIYD